MSSRYKPRITRCVLSGSFHKDRAGLISAYNELITCGCQVLSPHRLDFDSEAELFVRDTAEQGLSESSIEAHHLLAIRQSDFLWIHAPEGYIGLSVAFEIGYALAHKIPVFSANQPTGVVFAPYVHQVPSIFKVMESL